jgi:penicillin G amidase
MARVGRVALWILGGLALLLVTLALVARWQLKSSLPNLDRPVVDANLSAPVEVARDAAGIPTITAANRADLAFATGYLHAQERFFQMDSQRRAAAGELSELTGAATLDIDRKTRPHRFRARAAAEVAAMPAADRALLRAYVAGVNRGLGDLPGKPWEYLLLGATPEAWTPEDTVLVVYAMFFNLQGVEPSLELARAKATARLGPEMGAFLYPLGTELDAALDGSFMPMLPVPAAMRTPGDAPVARGPRALPDQAQPVGSNNWAVSGKLTTTGAALVANDMHLGTGLPNTWYRARLVAPGYDLVGVTLPGTPLLVAGSNGKIAWGFTNSYIDVRDGVLIEPVAGRDGFYATPEGPKALKRVNERLCAKAKCEDFAVEETIWGPVVATAPDGRKVADRWLAHDPGAVKLGRSLELERAGSVIEAVGIAHRAGIPNQNFTVGDRVGDIGWTIIGRIPDRRGYDGRDLVSFADGSKGWAGWLPPDAVPAVLNPVGQRIWTANSRVVGGNAIALLGDGGYDDGARTARIRDRLAAQDRFTEADMLSIQLDVQSDRNRFWQQQLLTGLGAKHPELRAEVARWNGRADADSVGYRLIRNFRRDVIAAAYGAYSGDEKDLKARRAPSGAEQAMRALLRAKPPALVPPGFASWDALLAAQVDALAKDVGGNVAAYTWGAQNVADVRHPLAKAIKPLRWLTDPADEGKPGDSGVPRAQGNGFGASERFAVSPGHEAQALFHMPGGQAGNPLSPYHLAGHRDWLEGRPSPMLPGKAKWVLEMRPQ